MSILIVGIGCMLFGYFVGYSDGKDNGYIKGFYEASNINEAEK